jgi:hypothetical protein
MTDLLIARNQVPEPTADAKFLREILAALLLLTMSTGGIVFALL